MDFVNNYQISLFGDYSDFISTTNDVAKFSELFKDENMILTMSQVNAISSKGAALNIKLRLTSLDNTVKLTVYSERIDLIFEGDNLLKTDVSRRAKTIIDKLLASYEFPIGRLALSLIEEIQDKKIVDIYNKLNKPLASYENSNITEWTTITAKTEHIEINNKLEDINVVYRINYSEYLDPKKSFFILADISTLQINLLPRFNHDDANSFFEQASVISTSLMKEIEERYE